ncbi:MAG: ATP-dependent sacrificial sulfur transferase LarE [Oscillospiraceae bacterium]
MSKKLQKLTNTLKEIAQDNKLCIAFSDGVDSTVLLKVATDAGINVLAVLVNTQLISNKTNIEKASQTAASMNAAFKVIEIDMLADIHISSNDKLRCYYCKSKMFTQIKKLAQKNAFLQVCDGTNADDLKEYRPGLKAKEENSIKSPLALCGLSKQDVRDIAAELSLKVAEKPSSPCILTRFPYATNITSEMLERVQAGESILKSNGFKNCRLRVHGDILRIEIPKPDFENFIEVSESINLALNELGFSYITLDLNGLRSGSMDLHI